MFIYYVLFHCCTNHVQALGLFTEHRWLITTRRPLYVAFFHLIHIQHLMSAMWNLSACILVSSVSSFSSYSIHFNAYHSSWLLWCICGSDDVVLCYCAVRCCYEQKASWGCFKLRQQPWDKKRWRIIVIVTTHSENIEEDGDGHCWFVLFHFSSYAFILFFKHT